MNRISLADLASNLEVPLKQFASGKVISLKGPLIVARLPDIAIGDICSIERRNQPVLLAQAVSFEEDLTLLAPFDELEGIRPNSSVSTKSELASMIVGDHLIGQVIDPLGRPFIDKISEEQATQTVKIPIQARAPNALNRKPINQILQTGIRSIDLFAPIGYGQRMGLFSGPGLGKSTLLGMIARNADVDISIIALVGERGREVNEFIHCSLGTEGLKKSIIVVSTSDESPMRRVMAAQSATAIAEYYRSTGKRVLLLVDSLTRVARAIRDVSLASGELPLRQGFTPSVYTQLPKILERAGNDAVGSITAIYTVLTQNDESNDALGEEVKSLLDGHIVLNNALANEGIRPAIDILASISRLKEILHSKEQQILTRKLLKIASRISKDKDIILMGGQADPELESALKIEKHLVKLLSQNPEELFQLKDSFSELNAIINEYEKG